MLYVLDYTQSRGGVVGLGANVAGLRVVFNANRHPARLIIQRSARCGRGVGPPPARARESVYEVPRRTIMQWGYGNQFLNRTHCRHRLPALARLLRTRSP